jgi:DEAD/DEAH box helicase domain-containing protein
VFGTNVGYILRRLRQICRLHGSDPRFVATSATVHDPAEHMHKLTGTHFECIDPSRDGSLQGTRKFWMVSNPAEHYYETGRKLALALAESGLSVLAFCPSRISAERMIAKLGGVDPDKRPWFRVYRSGLSPKQREEIEQGLRTRDVRLVFSTSALELGIDIGEIDVVVCIGLPSSMMSLWQRAGRSARGGRTGATVFIPADTPIDSYFASSPDELFSREHEPLVLNLTNQRIVCQHYACAVQEVGGDEDRLDLEILGPEMATVYELRKEGKLHRDEFYRADPHLEVNVRSAGEGSYSLVFGDEKIGEIDSFHLLRESYRNAVYRHGGQAYRVRDVIRGRRQVLLQREFTRNETTPFIQKKIRVKQQQSAAEYSGLRVAVVALDVTEFLVSVTEKDVSGKVIKTWQGAMGMPAHQLPTTGTMLQFKKPFWEEICRSLGATAGASLESCERLLCSLFPTISGPCDTQDYSSGIDRLPTGETAVFLYDLVYDGVDLTTVAFSKMAELVAKAEEHVMGCECTTDLGCFRCIANPLVNEVTSKAGTIKLLNMIGTMLREETARVTVKLDDWSERLHVPDALKCSACNVDIATTARFCPNCGEKVSI